MEPSGSIVASMVVRGKRLTFSEIDRVFGIASTSTWKCKPEVAAQVPDIATYNLRCLNSYEEDE